MHFKLYAAVGLCGLCCCWCRSHLVDGSEAVNIAVIDALQHEQECCRAAGRVTLCCTTLITRSQLRYQEVEVLKPVGLILVYCLSCADRSVPQSSCQVLASISALAH
jgi:hypothetical protein